MPFFQTEVDYLLTFQDGTTRTIRLNQTQASQGFSVPVSGQVASISLDPDGWLPDLPGTVQRDDALVLASAAVTSRPALLAFPNPCREQLTIASLPAAGATAEVCDATGRRLLRQALRAAQPQLATQALAPGLYHLRIFDAAGEVVSQGKFVRE
jgi:hypothetical protein